MKRCLLPSLLVWLAMPSCFKNITQAGGLELILTSDLPASELTRMHLKVSQEITPGVWHKVFDRDAWVPQEVSLPTTASIAAGDSPNQGALIVFTGSTGPNGDHDIVERVVQTQ